MTPFQRVVATPESIERICWEVLDQWLAGDPGMRAAFPQADAEAATAAIAERLGRELRLPQWENDTYQVAVDELYAPGVHLSIKRLDRQPVHDWRDLQAIKNELVGPECEAVELYPAESRRVDAADQYHLWCVKDPGYRFPMGFNGPRAARTVSSSSPIKGSVQRPFEAQG